MTDQDRSEFVSVAEAARILGLSSATVKRRVRAGTLEAEQLQRPQGYEYRVRVQRDVSAPSNEPFDSKSLPPLSVTTQDVSAAITAAMEPLIGRLAAQDVTVTAQVALIADLCEQRGRLTAELERAASSIIALSAENDALRASQRPQDASGAPEGRNLATVAPPYDRGLYVVVLAFVLFALIVGLYLVVTWALRGR